MVKCSGSTGRTHEILHETLMKIHGSFKDEFGKTIICLGE